MDLRKKDISILVIIGAPRDGLTTRPGMGKKLVLSHGESLNRQSIESYLASSYLIPPFPSPSQWLLFTPEGECVDD